MQLEKMGILRGSLNTLEIALLYQACYTNTNSHGAVVALFFFYLVVGLCL